ncbi:MAG: SprT family zinc-dependent metalloprotease [Bacilli bacterium]|nr:SprT family zinc-dependent metalloprotease [Bacilli bacterium]
MTYQIDNTVYTVVVHKKGNKNTYIRINDDLEIVINTSYLMPKYQIKEILHKNENAIIEMLNRKKKENQKKETFYYLGRKYDIIIVPTIDKIVIDGSYIYSKNKKELEKWYQKEMKQLFQTKLDALYPLFEETIPYPVLKIRNMKTRWGVCNRANNTVTLNAALMREPIECLEYVIVHELSHFVHFDHSKEFWKTVEKYKPNYKEIRKKMKE